MVQVIADSREFSRAAAVGLAALALLFLLAEFGCAERREFIPDPPILEVVALSHAFHPLKQAQPILRTYDS